MCRIHFHVHICSIPPFLPPSLKGKGKSTSIYAAHIYYLRVALWGALLNNKYARIHFHVHICNTSPLPPPSLKGKGTSTQALCSTYLLFKSGPLVKLNQLSYFSKSRLFISLTILDVLYYYFFGIWSICEL